MIDVWPVMFENDSILIMGPMEHACYQLKAVHDGNCHSMLCGWKVLGHWCWISRITICHMARCVSYRADVQFGRLVGTSLEH